jgi:CheY-like chemotaxis protein
MKDRSKRLSHELDPESAAGSQHSSPVQVGASPELAPLRVLVLEDEPLVAMVIEEKLEALGCITIGPTAELEEALRLVADDSLSCAILDVNVRGGHSDPVAKILIERGLPILLISGYGEGSLSPELRGLSRLSKPYTSQQLEHEIRHLCALARNSHRDRERWTLSTLAQ